jgi:hypothetical protein
MEKHLRNVGFEGIIKFWKIKKGIMLNMEKLKKRKIRKKR